jgi:CheY-like chemotaxis protein
VHIAHENPLPNSQSFWSSAAGNGTLLNPGRTLATPTGKRSPSKRVSKQKSQGRASKQTVLVVDDVADVTEMIALFLKHAGYEVTTSNSADNALEIAATQNFDLIISDIGMPEKNGYEFAESLRALSDYRTTPLIAVTGYTEYDDRGRSLRAGFNAHLTKPINPSQLLELISQLIG